LSTSLFVIHKGGNIVAVAVAIVVFPFISRGT